MMWIYSPRGTLRLWSLSTAAANKVAAPMLDPATRRLQGDSSRNANAAATQFRPQAKASTTTNSLAVVAGGGFGCVRQAGGGVRARRAGGGRARYGVGVARQPCEAIWRPGGRKNSRRQAGPLVAPPFSLC